jgi:Carboxypeptidase regulatory-like domain/TonB-dependent Receptor Plug Domain
LQTTRNFLSILGSFVILAALGGATVQAQNAVDGAIGGTVHDSTGSAIAGASVIVRNNATNAAETVVTDESGVYRAIHLQPGHYTLTVTAPGFGEFKSNDVTVEVGLVTTLQPTLNVGSSSQSVEVSGEMPLINTVGPDFNQVISQKELDELPVVNYRYSAYALQIPGVVESGGFGLLSVRGQSTLANNVTVDGADDNQAFFPDERGRTTVNFTIPRPAIEEFQINVSNYSTEYGRASGGVINAITKSGTNQFHGEGYYFDRDSAIAAQNDFTTKAEQLTPGSPTFSTVQFKPTDLKHEMGLGVGGPILRDKLFFYFSLDKYYHYFPLTLVASNPNLFFAEPSATLPGTTTCATISSSSTSANYDPNYTADSGACTVQSNLKLATYAQGVADFDSGLSGLDTMLGTAPRYASQTLFFPKVDWQINPKNRLSGEVNRLRFISPGGQQTNATASYGMESVGNIYVRDTWGIAKLDSIITSNISNEVRYQYGRDFNFAFNEKPTSYEENALLNTPTGYVNPNGIPPAVAITNGFTFGTATFLNRAAYPDERRWQATDTANWQHRNHSIKFGIDYIHTYDLALNLTAIFGSYSYTSMANYVTDFYLSQTSTPVAAANHYSTYSQGFGPLGFQFTTGDYAGFFQDDWKALPRLSLTYGVRYEFEQLPSPQLPNPLVPETMAFPSNKSNIAPRIGFSYELTGDGKTVVRGGWGIYNSRLENSTIYNAMAQTATAGAQNEPSLTPNNAGAPTFPQILTTATGQAAIPNVIYFDPNFKLPQVEEFDLDVQREIGWHIVASASYLGSLGRRLPDFVDQNLPTPTSVSYTVNNNNVANSPLPNGATYTLPFYGYATTKGAAAPTDNDRPDTRFSSKTDIFSGVNSSYDAMVLQVARSASQYLTFQGSYTWSHALDYGLNDTTFTSTNALFDPNNLKGEYGNSSHNVPNRFIATAVATSPWHAHGLLGYFTNDYVLAPSFSGQNGAPYTATLSGSLPSTSTGPLENTTGNGLIQGVSTSNLNGSGGENRLPGSARDAFKLPNEYILDMSGSKTITYHDSYHLELKASAYNILNRQNWTAANTAAYTVSNIGGVNTLTAISGSSSFGTVNNTNNNNIYVPREIQFEATFKF